MPKRVKERVRVGGTPQELVKDRLPTLRAIVRHFYFMAFALGLAFSEIGRLSVIIADDILDLWETLLPDLPLAGSRLDFKK